MGSYFKHFYGKKVIDDLFSKEKEISGLLTIKNFYKYRTDITVWLNKKKEEFDKKAINE
ncbi:MAG: hypothetical protein ACNI28_02070 [Arcobacter sp.]|uniref:hypothetical protein n=1 Tax=Arcobacter sp. TaxID=1872629 RepID=UPI003B00CB3D